MSLQPCLPVPQRKKKRRHKENENDHHEEEGENEISGRLTISDLSSMDASEYIYLVSREANDMPEMFVLDETKTKTTTTHNTTSKSSTSAAAAASVMKVDKKNPSNNNNNDNVDVIDGSAAVASFLLSNRIKLMEAPCSYYYLPKGGDLLKMKCWIDETLSQFSLLRQQLDTWAAEGVGSNRAVALPPMKDSMGWHIFCLGNDEANGNSGGYFDDDDDDDDDGNEEEYSTKEEEDLGGSGESQKTNWKSSSVVPPLGHSPRAELLLQMDQVMIRRVLSHHVQYIVDGWNITISRGAWIYALLARLDRSLHGNDAAMLRLLLRECCRCRAQQQQQTTQTTKLGSSSDIATINVIVAIVGLYFEQGGGIQEIFATTTSS